MTYKRWTLYYFIIPFVTITAIFTFNFVIDPYSMTNYNLLEIPNKFARDDRVEKVAKLKSSPAFDNIVLGSSRVYSSNPLMVSKYLGGSTYNAGVGTARVEDDLGFILLLQRLDKLPKNIIIGLDFYSFNEELETNKYFLKNEDLNFLNKKIAKKNYIANFLSIDALRASYKTLSNFIKHPDAKPRFDKNGASQNASKIFNISLKTTDPDKFSNEELKKEINFIKTISYKKISKQRLLYLQKITKIAREHNINLYLYLTPIYGKLLEEIQQDQNLYIQLLKLKQKIRKIHPFYDFMTQNSITNNSAYFNNPTHFTSESGNLIYAKIFHDKNITLPKEFGVYTK